MKVQERENNPPDDLDEDEVLQADLLAEKDAESFLSLLPFLHSLLKQTVTSLQTPIPPAPAPKKKGKKKQTTKKQVVEDVKVVLDVAGTQTVLLSLDGLATAFGSDLSKKDLFLAVVPSVQALINSPHTSPEMTQITASALLCLATLVSQLGTHMLAYLPSLARASINTLSTALDAALASNSSGDVDVDSQGSKKRKRVAGDEDEDEEDSKEVVERATKGEGKSAKDQGDTVLTLSCLAVIEALVAKLCNYS